MTSSTTVYARRIPRPLPAGRVAVFALLLSLFGCAGPAIDRQVIDQLPPLQHGGTQLTVADVAGRVPRADLLAVDEPMRQFVERYTAGQDSSRLQMLSLHQAVRGAGGLDMEYDPFADGTAREVFQRRVANCLSYANLFIALAREAGLEANYQWVEVRPQWSRASERVQLGLHVNVVVQLRDGKRYMVDIDPLPSSDISGSRELTDAQGEALYYNNIAMAALAGGETETAWLYGVRALQLSPEDAHLWANLGAIYRSSGQHREAEQSYLQALELDFTEYSAMTNLAVLYGLEGRMEERDYWLERVETHRRSNPYYHAWLGDEVAASGDWAAALVHYEQAVALAPGDSNLLFSRGVVHYQLKDYEAAARDMEEAINLATLHSDIANYQQQLEAVREAQLAGI
ncbi:MAG: tetratricopeptide repeat protein [Halieaceae bacterium]|jgi:Flp pilus assembly protein TadD|nr:tetratricopeptide repeat protein [Halieaceae bacterium]